MKSLSPYCISAYLVHNKNYLLIKRCSSYLNGTWQMISGGVDENETAVQAALREMKEETGITPDRFYTVDTVESFYIAKLDKILLVPVFVGFIDTPKDVILSPKEHDAYAWLPFEEAHNRLLFAEQKRVLTYIHHHFVMKEPHSFHLVNIV